MRSGRVGRALAIVPPGRVRLFAAVSFAVLVASAGAAGPAAAPVAAADDGLRVTTSATYEVEPADGLVRVVVDVRVTNTVPDRVAGLVRTRTYFDAVRLAIQPEASRVSASAAGRSLRASKRDRRQHDLVEIRLAAPLYHGDSARLRLRYDLPSGEPRSQSDVRVGVAFVTFVGWAFGDEAAVTIEMPAGFAPHTSGSSLEQRETSEGTVLTSGRIVEPAEWYAVVTGTRDAALTSERLALPEGVATIRGWPEDPGWVDHVADTLTAGLPVLGELIGLPWPVDGSLDIVETHGALLEGYGGFYDESSETITVSEDLDRHLILHETSHAWFNRGLFDERWIVEGLADAYAARALARLDGSSTSTPEVRRDDPSAFPLQSWTGPRPIVDEAGAARERYGYDASQLVIGEIVDRASLEGIRKVLHAVAGHEIAYLGDRPPERAETVPDWSRLLDLVEERTTARVGDLFEEWVLDPTRAAQLDARDRARSAYQRLVAAGDGWLPPLAVRGPMARWRFAEAMTQIDAASDVLAQREEIDDRAAALGVTVPVGLEAAYEGAEHSLADTVPVARARLDALTELEGAAAAVARPRDLVASIGLLEAPPPESELSSAKAAFADGDLAGAIARSDAIEATLVQASELGRTRLLAGGMIVLLAVLILVTVLAVAIRRRRHAPGGEVGADVALATLPPTSLGDDRAVGPDGPAGERGD